MNKEKLILTNVVPFYHFELTESARHLTAKAGEQVSVSNRQMEEMLSAMEEISERMEQIRLINKH